MISDATVVVVDDHRGRSNRRVALGVRGLIGRDLRLGGGVFRAYDPKRPGCLMLDLRMPEMDGLELQRRLAARGYHPPIVFVSGDGHVLRCAAAMEGGGRRFLEKPADDAEMLAVVHLALEMTGADVRGRGPVTRRLRPASAGLPARTGNDADLLQRARR